MPYPRSSHIHITYIVDIDMAGILNYLCFFSSFFFLFLFLIQMLQQAGEGDSNLGSPWEAN